MNGDEIRTFWTNPGGFITKENDYSYIYANGHTLKEKNQETIILYLLVKLI